MELLGLFKCVCSSLCTIVAHNTAQNRPDNFPSCLPNFIRCSYSVLSNVLLKRFAVVVSAAEDDALELAPLTIAASRTISPPAMSGANVVSSGRSSVVAADVAVEPVADLLPPRSASMAVAGSVQDSPGVSYHAGVTLDSQWSSAQNDTAAAAAATAAVYNNSYFGAHQAAPVFGQRPQRPLHDIVSSMQGSFHFLQESQIELESM